MKKTLNIILFGRKKSYFVKCTLTLIGLYLGVLFWYFNVDYLGQPIQNSLVLAVYSLICISVLVALYRIPEQLCVNSQIEKLLYFPVNPTNIIYMVIIRLFKIQILSFICCFLSSIYFFKWNVLPLILTNSCIYALVGVNGIGKSTFLNSIIQPSTLDKGSVKIDDIPSTDFTAKYHYAFVPDTKDMFLNLTGKEYLQFVSELYNQKEKFDELLAIYIPKLKLENSLEQTISSYSLGMKQKIYLAGAFMSNAQNIILDEPFNAIDPESTSIIKKILFDLKDTGKMILFSVHNLDLVSNFCDKIIFIDNRHSIFECNNPQNFDVLEKIFFDKCVIKK